MHHQTAGSILGKPALLPLTSPSATALTFVGQELDRRAPWFLPLGVVFLIARLRGVKEGEG